MMVYGHYIQQVDASVFCNYLFMAYPCWIILSTMGITGLLPLLKDITQPCNLDQYRKKRVAVDTYSWLHKSIYTCCIELATNQPTDKWLKYCMNMVELLLSYDIKIYLVFDGADLPAKKSTEEERRKSRAKNLEKGLALHQQGDSFKARSHFSAAVNVTPYMAAQFIQKVRHIHPSVEILVSPYEADAQLAFLSINDYVDAVISEDSDTIPYGCKEVLYKLDNRTASCHRIILSDIFRMDGSGLMAATIPGVLTPISSAGSTSSTGKNNRKTLIDFRSFSFEMILLMCVASGCDYLSSVRGMGIKNSYKYTMKHKEPMKLLKNMRLEGLLPIEALLSVGNGNGNGNSNSNSNSGSGGNNSRVLLYEYEFCKV